MCYSGCRYENWYGECKARPFNDLYPCDEGYTEARGEWEGERDAAAEARAEELREARIAAQESEATKEDS